MDPKILEIWTWEKSERVRFWRSLMFVYNFPSKLWSDSMDTFKVFFRLEWDLLRFAWARWNNALVANGFFGCAARSSTKKMWNKILGKKSSQIHHKKKIYENYGWQINLCNLLPKPSARVRLDGFRFWKKCHVVFFRRKIMKIIFTNDFLCRTFLLSISWTHFITVASNSMVSAAFAQNIYVAGRSSAAKSHLSGFPKCTQLWWDWGKHNAKTLIPFRKHVEGLISILQSSNFEQKMVH